MLGGCVVFSTFKTGVGGYNRSVMQNITRLTELLRARHPCIRITTADEPEALAIIHAAAAELRLPVWEWSVARGLRDGEFADAPALPDTNALVDALIFVSRQQQRRIVVLFDSLPHLAGERERESLRVFREQIFSFDKIGAHFILIDAPSALPPGVEHLAHPFDVLPPDDDKLRRILKETVQQFHQQQPIRAQLAPHEAELIIRNLRGLSTWDARQIVREAIAGDMQLNGDDANRILAAKRKRLQAQGMLEYVEAPVNLNEIGGLRNLKAWLKARQNAFRKDATQFGLPAPRGMLMLGVQGAGKSLSAKAVATAWQRPLLRLDVGALYDKFIGESERRLRDTLRQAEMMAPIILWIDEIEKAFAGAASQSIDGGLSKRMFGTLLTWMQEHKAPVFLIATANDIAALPPELMRKGRFDEIFFVDLPTIEARHQIIEIHLKRRNRPAAKFDLDSLAEASNGFSGAEIEQAIVSALHEAYSAQEELSTEHVMKALRSSPPLSVTMAENVEALRRWASGRCVPAD